MHTRRWSADARQNSDLPQVLIHGMWGCPSHLASTARVIQEVKGSKNLLVDAGAPDLHVLVAVTNAEDHTYDGIDNGGERVAQEVSSPI